jgi:ABC-2 type transport system permease protein
MTTFIKMTWLEGKLFLREPLTVLFALVLPLVILFVLGGVFGDGFHGGAYRGVPAIDYYVPAYVALVAASLGLVSLPTLISSNRERGVLKRYRASAVPAWVIVGSQVAVTVLISLVSAVVLVVAALPVYEFARPDSMVGVMAALVLVAFAFASLGVTLGAILPTARSAQALGVLLWFLMLILGGAGPPPDIFTGVMKIIGDLTPLRFAIWVMQDGWLGLDPGGAWLIMLGITVLCASLSIRFFQWESTTT